MKLKFHDTLSDQKRDFTPLDKDMVRMYVCGPTVYDVPHIGNIRASVVYDIVYRVLLRFFPKVTYVRNITDVDDKIIDAASKQSVKCDEIALCYEKIFHEHLALLSCLPPDAEPKATQNIEQMISMIQRLIENGNAYPAGGNVYFDVGSFSEYGALSKRRTEELVYGVRIDSDENKRHPGDFVLWKHDDKVCWPSPWGNGRPGWHIECSAMTLATLGADFDIHGGGADLKFPHHENEIAQSMCASPGSRFARYWIHNGFLTVNGEKMSKSLGNIVNVDTLINAGITANVIRFALISTHYSRPLDWNHAIVEEATHSLMKFKVVLVDNGILSSGGKSGVSGQIEAVIDDMGSPKSGRDDKQSTESYDGYVEKSASAASTNNTEALLQPVVVEDNRECTKQVFSSRDIQGNLNKEAFFQYAACGAPWNADSDCNGYMEAFFMYMGDDFNTPGAISVLYELKDKIRLADYDKARNLALLLDGLLLFLGIDLSVRQSEISEDFINVQIQKRAEYKQQKNFVEADKIRDILARAGVLLRDYKDASTDWIVL